MALLLDADTTQTLQPRVVSLLSGLTEAVHLMDLGHLLVGRSHECDWPPEVLSLPPLSQPRVDPEASAADIDAQVHEVLQASGTAYELNVDELKQLRPTLLLVQDSCRICAVSPLDLGTCDFGGIMLSGCSQVLTVFPKCLEDVFKDMQSVADALNQPEKGRKVITQLRSRLEAVQEGAWGLAQMKQRQHGPQPAPRVVVLEWCSPLMGSGYWIPELVRLAGGQCLFGGLGEHTEYISIEDLAQADPDYIIFACCGFSVGRSINEICQTLLLSNSLWKSSAAVRSNQVFVTDGNRYFNRSGPSVVDTAEIIAQILGSGSEHRYDMDAIMSLREAIAHFKVKPMEMPALTADTDAESCLHVEHAVGVVRHTVEALQTGTEAGCRKAYENSAVSACMAFDLYKSSILGNPDFLPLSNTELAPRYEKPSGLEGTRAKIEVAMEGDGGASYVFRMLAVGDMQLRKWMIEGVCKVA